MIDTGALITGYSNQDVARKLLDLGLTWCDGVVFLDSDDKQQVLVRATGRVVSADQCGVSLDRRFAFYDQIHTTGMDIKHVVNATAVITLGKDMVFRDYVQGAYRMRGIGAGQRIHVYIIPEVRELMQRELKEAAIRGGSESDHVLEDVVAWLVVNSLRSEQTQWTMLCIQNIGNLYRKNAFDCLLCNTQKFVDGISVTVSAPIEPTSSTKPDVIEDESRVEELGSAESVTTASTTELIVAHKEQVKKAFTPTTAASISVIAPVIESDDFIESLDPGDALKLFDEEIDFSLEASVPDPLPFERKLRGMLDAHEAFLRPVQHEIGHRYKIISLVLTF